MRHRRFDCKWVNLWNISRCEVILWLQSSDTERETDWWAFCVDLWHPFLFRDSSIDSNIDSSLMSLPTLGIIHSGLVGDILQSMWLKQISEALMQNLLSDCPHLYIEEYPFFFTLYSFRLRQFSVYKLCSFPVFACGTALFVNEQIKHRYFEDHISIPPETVSRNFVKMDKIPFKKPKTTQCGVWEYGGFLTHIDSSKVCLIFMPLNVFGNECMNVAVQSVYVVCATIFEFFWANLASAVSETAACKLVKQQLVLWATRACGVCTFYYGKLNELYLKIPRRGSKEATKQRSGQLVQ